MYKGSLYCAYSKPSIKPSFLSLSSSSDSSWFLLIFIFCPNLQSFARYSSLSHLQHLLFSLSLFGLLQSFVKCLYILQLKHFGFSSLLKLSLDFLISIGAPYSPNVISIPILQLCQLSMNSYPCSTEVIATFYSLSISNAAISRYSSIVLIISAQIFFFNRNITCMSLVFTFIAKALNSIMKLAMCFLHCQNVLIFHLASAVLLLSLKTVLISLTNSSQSQESLMSSSLLIFFCI